MTLYPRLPMNGCRDGGQRTPSWSPTRSRTQRSQSKRRERKPSVATLIKRAEKAGKTVTAITTDGVTLQFGEASPAKHNSWDDLETEKRQ